MSITRREFSTLTSILAMGALAGGARAAGRGGLGGLGRSGARPGITRRAGTYFEWKQVAPSAWVGIGEGGNSLVVASKGELLLVDTKFAAFAGGLRREAQALVTDTKHSLSLVINTHHHMDHSGGNIGFLPDVPVLAQEKARPRIESQVDRCRQSVKGHAAQLAQSDKPGAKEMLADATKLADHPDMFDAAHYVPTRSFATEHEAKIGELVIELRHYGSGHTDNDAVVRVPSLNIVHMGDLLFHKIHPFMDVSAGSNSDGWMDSCRKALALCDDKTVVIPGHGDVTDKKGLEGQIDYFETMRKAVREAVAAGKSRDEVTKMSVDALKEYGQNRLSMVLGALYDEQRPSK
ncbi:MAG: MBL fold metallo-hydrolase [Phycisphaerales bacterium]